ncbi:MAG: efflux RND transporter periplasmic adaptor subunit [Proteobacteria bacterium]|nr:efflux RND transporter periplasmic adaptor subunit [Pseudomonadota bacterium]
MGNNTSTMTYKAISLLLLLLLAACSANEDAPATTPAPRIDGERIIFAPDSYQAKAFVAIQVEQFNKESLRLNGRLVWDEGRTVRMFAPMAGRVVKLLAEAGQTVKAGETLALVSSPEFGQAQAEERRAEADFAVTEKGLGRARELYQHGVIAAKDFQQAEADYARASAEHDRTLARAKQFGAPGSVNQQMPLKAPIGGVVVERNVNPGQEVRPDQAQPGSPALYVISDPSRLWVQLELPEAALAQVRTGMPFMFKGAGIGGEPVGGRIEWIADSLDPATRTTRARGSVTNPSRRLKAEMFVTAELEIDLSEHLRVPATAVILLGDAQYVFVEEGRGHYIRRKIVAIESGLGRMNVREGLAAGERIVTDGVLLLHQTLVSETK